MFDVYKKTVTINKVSYELLPLPGEYLGTIFELANKFKDKKGVEVLDLLDKPTISEIHKVCLATIQRSYPDKDVKMLDPFVSQNLMTLFPLVVELNLPQEDVQS